MVDTASEEADFVNLQANISKFNFHISTVRNNRNLGFSGGNNVGIRQAIHPSARSPRPEPLGAESRDEALGTKAGQETGSLLRQGFVGQADWVVLINNDTWVERDFVERLRAVLRDKSGVVSIPLIENDRVAYYGQIQWLKPTLIHMTDIQCRSLGKSQIYAIGGAMAVHKDIFEKIGLLDEKYFLYFEDADFSVRAGKAGFDISIAKNLNAHHHVSSSTKKLGSPLLLRYHYRNALYFNRKNGPWYIKLLVWPWSLIIVIKQLSKLVINKNKEQSKAILAGVTDFYKNKMGKIKTGTEASRH